MAKTQETRDLEKALQDRCAAKGEYGCSEVTIGFVHGGNGREIVDFLSMDSEGVFKCFEIKVTLADLRSDAKLSWYGDYNYLVVSEELYRKSPAWDNYIPPYAGILAGTGLSVKRRAKKIGVAAEQRALLQDSMIRSLYWRMEEMRRNSERINRNEYAEQIEEQRSALAKLTEQYERKVWEAQDYETYYRRNHQDCSFTIAGQAKVERSQYRKRTGDGYTWIHTGHGCICPACGQPALIMDGSDVLSAFCPHCGSDLRLIDHEEDPA